MAEMLTELERSIGPNVVLSFTPEDRQRLENIERTLNDIIGVIGSLLPMVEGLKDSPIGKMLGI